MCESAFAIAARALAVLARQRDEALAERPARIALPLGDARDGGLIQADAQADFLLRHPGRGECGDGI